MTVVSRPACVHLVQYSFFILKELSALEGLLCNTLRASNTHCSQSYVLGVFRKVNLIYQSR
uniref:Putative ovule protein n=1 Tax=Solanum chacoense TaxID=4108 RepID=A0A0V0GXQ1_SOLCH